MATKLKNEASADASRKANCDEMLPESAEKIKNKETQVDDEPVILMQRSRLDECKGPAESIADLFASKKRGKAKGAGPNPNAPDAKLPLVTVTETPRNREGGRCEASLGAPEAEPDPGANVNPPGTMQNTASGDCKSGASDQEATKY